ncbi:MAG: lipid A phosphoethanolamine transferase [Alistipes sp.]|nr:lipid A phosphoethanolamine transferase [Alistipes sp.]
MSRNRKYHSKRLLLLFIGLLMLPVLALAYTEHNPFWVTLTGILLPLGFYTIFASLSARSGRMVWWGFAFIFLSAFQLVLLYLFGNSVIMPDMFLNLVTTNTSETAELLSNIYPSVILVCVLYFPILWYATRHLRHKVIIPAEWRHRVFVSGCVILLAGMLSLWIGCRGEVRRTLRDEVFPVNAIYNLGISISEAHKTAHFDEMTQEFEYQAYRDTVAAGREIYVLVLGEASRASSWQLYGYERPTNPLLSSRDDICLFRGVTTQSNTTHKSVPMMLSSVHTSQHDEIYRRKGIPALFNEAGFTTYFISNQQPQGAMIDNLAKDAHHIIYIGDPHYDMQMVDAMREAISTNPAHKMLFILHAYGSHFSYHQRYPRQFAMFLPDDDVAIARKNATMMHNAYDNSILYTDYFIHEIIRTLESFEDVCGAMFYCSDHGEDIFDNDNGRFLHSSPMVTYHQLHVASLAWFSKRYVGLFGDKVVAAHKNTNAPATTHSVFHTMADIASISTPYLRRNVSLVSELFDYDIPRLYLNGHNKAVVLNAEIGIDSTEEALFRRAGITLR